VRAEIAPPVPSRFHSLDVLRGLAALAVVHTHWYIFFAGTEGIWAAGRQPFHALLGPR
jgi:peptidoglycan/LPS O-acetylase OafA/YrhL